MTPHKAHRRLTLPRGTEHLQLAQTRRHRAVHGALEAVFDSWGYLPVETPLVDYFDVYARLLSEDAVKRTYRALDRHGDLLLIRSDTTLFLAKQLGIHVRSDELPIRVYYNAQILRHEGEHAIGHNEYHQSGVELVGVAGIDGDVEILCLLDEAVRSLNLDNAKIHLGSHEVIDAIVESAGVVSVEGFEKAVRLRNRPVIERSLAGLPKRSREVIEPLLLTIREAPDFISWWHNTPRTDVPEQVILAVEAYTHLINALDHIGIVDRFRADISELGAQDYYTGMACAVYVPDADDAIARGGRYDRLLQSFGFTAPSVGFSMYTRKIPFHLSDEFGQDLPVTEASGETIVDRILDAREKRAKGQVVRL